MSIAIADFWKLVVESRLLTAEQVAKLQGDFAGVKGSAQATSKVLAEWLISKQAVSRYQATVLLAGRPGPFYYGDYRVYDRVDSGELKGQFRAVHAPSGHPVLLRFLGGTVLKDQREWALVAARVVKQAGAAYPLLQRYFEPVDLQAFRFIASEDLRGETLDQLLAKHGRLPPMEAARIVRLTAFALSYLHQLGIVHGDVRPGQILLEPGGNIKLLVDPAQLPGPINVAQLDPNSAAAAKADYLAPEFLQASKTPDVKTDIYALGCTFYQLLTGQVPFSGGLPGQKLARHAAEPIQPLEPYGVPHPLAQLVAFMMAKNPAVRTQQAALVAEQLAPFIEPARLNFPATAPAPTLSTYENWIKQKQAVLSTAATVKPTAPAGPAISINPVALANSPGAVVASPASPLNRTSSRKKNPLPMLVGGGVAAALLVIVLIVIAANSGGEDPREVAKKNEETLPTTNVSSENPAVRESPLDKKQGTTTPPQNNPGTQGSTKQPAVEVPVAKYEVQPDDGKLLWASPTAGSPIELANVPPNAQIFLFARPAEILASPHGQKVIDALGPQFASHRATWEKATGVKLADVTQLVVALHDNLGKMPRVSYRVQLTAPVAENELVARWGNPAPTGADGLQYYEGAGRAYYVPPGGSGSVFVMGDPTDIKELVAAKGAPPVLRREIDQLRRLSDADRHFTLLCAPNYLSSDGRDLFTGPYQKLLEPISWFLGDDCKAAMSSLHFSDSFYAELRAISDISRDKNKLAIDLRDRMAQAPIQIENYMTALNAPPYWKKVANRYPGMIFLLHRNTRAGVEDDVAIINAAAPGALAHNLVFGGELALMSTPGAMVASTNTPAAGSTAPKNIDEVLKHKITFEEPGNDMNLVMTALEKEVTTDLPSITFPFAIKIIGKDLELEGITRNQSIRNFKMENTPLAEVLTGLVRKANPVTTVKDPSEVDQKLIWVVGPDPDKPDQQVVLITTRKAAESKKYTLPAPFVPKG